MQDDKIDRLERLYRLRSSGAVTEQEYDDLKQQILSPHELPTDNMVPSDPGLDSEPAAARQGNTGPTVSQSITSTLAISLVVASTLAGMAAAGYTTVRAANTRIEQQGMSVRLINDMLDRWGVADTFARLFGLVFFLAGALFLVWMYLSYNAAQARGATSTKWSPEWAVGSWFVPIANLAIPKLCLDEIDRMSTPELARPIGDEWRTKPRLVVSDWWWGIFVVAILIVAYDTLTVTVSHRILIPILGYALFLPAGILGAITVSKIGRRLS